MAQERMTVDPNGMRGLPSIRDTHVTVSAALGQLAAGASIDELLATIPTWNARMSSPRSNAQRPLRTNVSWQL